MKEVMRNQSDDDEQSLGFGDAEDQREDFHHRKIDPSQDDAVDRDAEIEGAKSAKEGRGLTRIADLGKFDVRHHA